MKILKITTIAASLVSMVHAAPTSFSDTLKSYSGQDTASDISFLNGSGFEPTTVGATEAISFDADGAIFGDTFVAPTVFNEGWETRNYLRTTEEGYGAVSFIAYVTAQRDFVPTYGINGLGTVYFGLGSANARFFRTPDGNDNGSLTNTSTFFRWQAQEFISWHAGVKGQATEEVSEIGFAGESTPRQQGTTRLMMAYDSVGKTVLYAIDYDYDGFFVADQDSGTIDVSATADEFASGERASIYFGSNGEVSFSDFSVQLLNTVPAGPVSFSNSLEDYADNYTDTAIPPFLLGSGLEPSTTGATEVISFDANGAIFGESFVSPSGFNEGWETRNYLRTTEQGYGTVSFTAAVTVQRDFVPTYGTNGYGAVYFGLGSANPRYFRTPDGNDNGSLTNTSTFFRWQAQEFVSWHAGVKGQSSQEIPEIGFGFEPAPRKQGTTRLEMAYDAVAMTVIYSIDYEYDGSFVADQDSGTIDVSALTAEFAAGERSSIFFGSNGEVSFSDLSVVVAGSGSPYEAWAGAAGFTDDANNDGVANGIAWILGADNPATNANDLLPTPVLEAGFLSLSFQRVSDIGAVNLSIEHSSDLGVSDPWTVVNLLEGPLGDVVVTDTAGSLLNSVVVKVPTSNASASGKLFVRIVASQP